MELAYCILQLFYKPLKRQKMKSSNVLRPLSIVLFIIFLAGCNIENYIAEVASVITEPASSVTDNSAVTGGEVTENGGAEVTSRGVRYTRRGDPNFVVYWDSTINGSETGVFTSNLTGLKAVSTYYVRAYAYNSEGIAFGNMIDFTTSGASAAGSFTDSRDGATYRIIRIGNQHWMKENLAYASANGSWCYDHDQAKCDVYGRLYDFETARVVCPPGWHLPSDQEWKILEMFIGLSAEEAGLWNLRGFDEAGKLKQESTLYWDPPNEGATNLTGFTALPGGFYTPGYDSFEYLGEMTHFWTNSEYSDNEFQGIIRALDHRYRRISRETGSKTKAFSVRCVRN